MLSEFNVNTPYPTDDFKDIYSHIRNIKERFGERFGLEHYIGSSQDTSLASADGYHKYLVLPPQTTFPTLPTGASYVLFTMLINNIIELCCRKSDGVYQLTRNGKIRYKYEVGDTGPGGGYICYKNASGYCLEVMTTLFTSNVWSNIYTVSCRATGTAIGTGLSNTNTIIAQSGHTTSAAKLCRDYRGGGFTDWFLPSKDEIIAASYGGLPWISTGYTLWSSTEMSATGGSTYQTKNNTFREAAKDNTYPCRAMRSFTDNTKYKKIG